jgi:hypothetical protein
MSAFGIKINIAVNGPVAFVGHARKVGRLLRIGTCIISLLIVSRLDDPWILSSTSRQASLNSSCGSFLAGGYDI